MTEALSWLPIVSPLSAALALLLVPGLIATSPLRIGTGARLALAGPLSIVAIGAAGVIFAVLDARYAVWQPLAIVAVLCIVGYLIRRRIPPIPGRVPLLGFILTLAGTSLLIAVVAFAGVRGPDAVSQTYDNVFHLSAIADILRTGDASSLTLRTLIETDRSVAYYPAGWHSLVVLVVQLTGASIPVAVNASWIAVCAAVWLPGIAWLSAMVVRRANAALIALPLGAAFGAMPFALLPWGTLYPTFLATALIPAALACVLLMLRAATVPDSRARLRNTAWGVGGVGASALAIAFAQPRALVTLALLAAVPASVAVFRWGRRTWRALAHRPGARRTIVVGVTLIGVALVVVGWAVLSRAGFFDEPLEDRLTGPQAAAMQPTWVAIAQVLTQSWLTGSGDSATIPALPLAVVVLVGAVVAWRRPSRRWLVVSAVLVALLFVLASSSDDNVTKILTGLWYKDKFRLSSALPVVLVPLAVIGIGAVCRRLRHRRGVAIVLAWAVAATSAAALAFGGMTASIGSTFRMPPAAATSEIVSAEQIRFFDEISQIVPADQRILGDPWDGSAWTLVFGAREPVFPHVTGAWDPQRVVLAWELASIETNPAVCAALDDIRVRYVLYDPHAFGGGDPAGNHFPGPHAAVEAGLFRPVAQSGTTVLYEITQCGPLAK